MACSLCPVSVCLSHLLIIRVDMSQSRNVSAVLSRKQKQKPYGMTLFRGKKKRCATLLGFL